MPACLNGAATVHILDRGHGTPAFLAGGGVKDSGLGREGPKYTIEEMTEPRLLVINRRAL